MRALVVGVSLALLACAESTPSPQPSRTGSAQASTAAPPKARKPPPPPRAEETLTVDHAASPAAAKVIGLVLELRDSVSTTAYQARTEVDSETGHYAWDCSGMADWILRRTAPKARRALRKSRPRAIDFYKTIARSPTERARRGWQRLEHVSDARPGDVFAFPRSPLSKSKISGHVGFLVEAPWKFEDWPYEGEAWAARILDAAGLPHQNDTRARDSEGGFGFGTFLFVNDEEGKTIAYGWFGTRSRGFLPTKVVYGRVTR